MTLYVAQEDLYFQEVLKYFDKESIFTLDAWKFFEPLSDDLIHTFKTIAPYAVFEYLANTSKARKNTIKFYQLNKSAIENIIDTLPDNNDYQDRQTWNDIQIKYSTFPLDEQKMIRDVLIYCSIIQNPQVETFVIQNFAHISSLIKFETDLQKLINKHNIENLDVQKLPDLVDKIRFTNFKDKSFPQLLIKSDTLTPSAYNKWYSYIFVKTYMPSLAKKLPKNLVLTDSHLVPELLLYSGSKFLNSKAIDDVLNYSDEIDNHFNNGIKIKPNELKLGSEIYHIKTNSTLNDILDLIITDRTQKLTDLTTKALQNNLEFHLKNHHTKAYNLTNETKHEIKEIISKHVSVNNAKSIIFNLLNKHPLLSEILNKPLSNKDLLKINQTMAIYNSIISEIIDDHQITHKDLLLFNTGYIQFLMAVCLTLMTKIESQTIITETKEIIKTDSSLQQKITLLETQLQNKDEQIIQLSKDASRVDTIKDQLNEAKSRIQILEKKLNETRQIKVQPIYHNQTLNLEQVESRLNNTDVTFVGGHQSWQTNTKVWASKATFIHPDETSRQLPTTTKILIINTSYLNHSLYHQTKNVYETLKDCQLLYLNSQSTNKNMILTELSKQIKL